VVNINSLGSGKFELILDDTVLYPEGGGQPSDHGVIEDEPVTYAEQVTTGVQFVVSRPFEVGAQVRCKVDWSRRYDFMQQHTGQHLLSAVASNLFGAETIHWELGSENTAVDLKSDTLLTQENIDEIEHAVNAEIRMARNVLCRSFPVGEFDQIPHKRGVAKGAAAELEELRVVTIEGLDSNPCGGTHVRNICELQMIKFVALEKEKGATRIRFIAGGRVFRTLTGCLRRESQLVALLAAPPKDHVDFIDKMLKDRRGAAKERKQFTEELAAAVASLVLASRSTESNGDPFVKHYPGADLPFLQCAAEAIAAGMPQSAIFLSGDNSSTVPSVSQAKLPPPPNKKRDKQSGGAAAEPVSTAVDGIFVMFGDPKTVSALKDSVLSAISGRGGGRPGRLQGTFDAPRFLGGDSSGKALEQLVRDLLATGTQSAASQAPCEKMG
jgi:misacylated tRNA(Ala) deacylase